jgi:hypothetical protein
LAPDPEFARRLAERTEFLSQKAQDLVRPSILSGDLIVLRLRRIKTLGNAYFILNECFKRRFIKPDHNTEFPKVAALTTMAIMTVLPFRPMNLGNVRTVGEHRCNELYAFNCISAILGISVKPDEKLPEKFWLRLAIIFSTIECFTLKSYITDVNNDRAKEPQAYFRNLLEADDTSVQKLIAICELLCAARKKDGHAQSVDEI